jgi:hypothetical protein
MSLTVCERTNELALSTLREGAGIAGVGGHLPFDIFLK